MYPEMLIEILCFDNFYVSLKEVMSGTQLTLIEKTI